MPEVKIIWISLTGTNKPDGRLLNTEAAERKLAGLLADGWQIVTAGGGFGTGMHDVASYGGFVILRRDGHDG